MWTFCVDADYLTCLHFHSRPGSLHRLPADSPDQSGGDTSDEGSTSDHGHYNVESERDDEPDPEGSVFRDKSDTRSILSFSSMMSRERDYGDEREKRGRPSLTDRLANMPSLHRLGVSFNQHTLLNARVLTRVFFSGKHSAGNPSRISARLHPSTSATRWDAIY